MSRRALGYAALAVSFVIVFAPRPWTPSSIGGGGEESLFSRVLAPTMDHIDARDRNVARAFVQAAPLWLGLLAALLFLPTGRPLYYVAEVSGRRIRSLSLATRSSRAPPLSLA